MAQVLSRAEALTYEGPDEDVEALDVAMSDALDVVTAEPPGVVDVAAVLLAALGPMDSMRLQKLCYYTQVIHLARTEQPLFFDRIEAWRHGPVSPALFQQHRQRYRVAAVATGDPQRVDEHPTAMAAVNEVIQRYGMLSGHALSELTHREQPWLAARNGADANERSNELITIESMRRFYTEVLRDTAWVGMEYDDRPVW